MSPLPAGHRVADQRGPIILRSQAGPDHAGQLGETRCDLIVPELREDFAVLYSARGHNTWLVGPVALFITIGPRGGWEVIDRVEIGEVEFAK